MQWRISIIRAGDNIMKLYKNQVFDEERALYGTKDDPAAKGQICIENVAISA